MLYHGEHNEETKNWDDRFLIRRARLKFDGFVLSPRVVYKIELGLSNSDIGSGLLEQNNQADNVVLDAVAKWQMTETLFLWFGQTKLPGNRERVISSQNLQFVDRSLLNAQFNLDRDAGIQLRNEHAIGGVVFREIGSVSMGEGRNITVTNTGGYDYTARLEVLPFGEFIGDGDYVSSDLEREPTPKLAIAASYDYNDNASRSRGQLGSFLSEKRDLSTWFVDAMFKFRGLSFMGEYANRKALNGPVVSRTDFGTVEETFVTGEALNLQVGYVFPIDWEIAGRYTSFSPTAATSIIPEKQYTLGISRYIVGHNLKVQSDFTLIRQPNIDDYLQARLQMELSL
nr:porin [Pontibacter harenae]